MTSRNLDDLIAIEDRFQPRLKHGEYTVIAPENKNEFERFIGLANKYFAGSSMHELLSNRAQLRSLLRILPSNVKMEIYVVEKKHEALLRNPIHEYIKKHRLDFKI